MSETLSPSPEAAPEPIGTFARAIIVESSGHPVWRTVDYAASLAIHVVIIGVLTILPLFFLEALHPQAFTPALFVSAIPPPLDQFQSTESSIRPAHASDFALNSLIGPIARPGNAIAATSADAVPPVVPIPSGVTGGIANLLDGISGGAPLVFPVPPPDGQMVLAGSSLSGSRLIYGLSLAYPAAAKMAHVFGKVIIEAIIDENGNVRRVRAMSGPDSVGHRRRAGGVSRKVRARSVGWQADAPRPHRGG